VAVLGVRAAGVELSRMMATLIAVVAAAALGIAALGALPGWLGGERAVERVGTVQDAERRVAARVVLPAYIPDRFSWPPSEVRVSRAGGGSVLVVLTDRAGAPALQIAQAVRAGAQVSPALLGAPDAEASREVSVGARRARLSTVLLEGDAWQELSWEVNGRAFVLRSRGGADELLRMAHSAGGGR
jgi:hypothetical protein